MEKFKNLATEVIINFTTKFQDRRSKITDDLIHETLSKGDDVALTNANQVLQRVELALGFDKD